MRQLIFAAALAVPGLAFAQTAPEPAAPDPTVSDDRFQIEREGDVYIRLDKKTGTISTCSLEGDQLDCRLSADERAALQAEIDRLAAEVEQLKTGEGGEPKTGLSKDGKELTLKLPSEAEIQEFVDYFEDMLRRLVDAVKSLGNGGNT